MSKLLIAAIIFMTLALTFYTIGVFGEKEKRSIDEMARLSILDGLYLRYHRNYNHGKNIRFRLFIQPAWDNRPDCPSFNGISCRLGGIHTCKKQ